MYVIGNHHLHAHIPSTKRVLEAKGAVTPLFKDPQFIGAPMYTYIYIYICEYIYI